MTRSADRAQLPPPRNVAELLDVAAADAPHRRFLAAPDAGRSFTRADVRDAVAALRAALRRAGVRPGERVGILLSNGPNLVASLLAVIAAGATAVPVNPRLAAGELAAALDSAGATHVLTDREHRSLAPTTVEPWRLTSALEPANPLTIARTHAPAAPARAGGEVPALVLFTSGTTGTPKGVPLTERNLLANAAQVAFAHRLAPSDVALCVLPIFHINGLVVTTLAPLLSGGEVVMPRRFDPERFWSLVAAHRVTWFSAVPTILSLLLSRPAPPASAAGTLRFARSASAPLPVAVLAEFEARFGVPVIESLGMSEAAGQVTSNPLPPARRKPGSVGRAYGNEVRVVDDSARPLPPGSVGEVAVRGENVFGGYLGGVAPEALRDGWLLTGDLGYLDADGYLFLTGRRRELINRAGEKIAPREVEEVLHRRPEIETACVVGVPDPLYGEEVVAFVELRPGRDFDAQAIAAFCREHLARFKTPKRIFHLHDWPRGPNGKVQRRRLLDLYRRFTSSNERSST